MTELKEEWVDIKYNVQYQISNKGEVRKKNNDGTFKILKSSLMKIGYLKVSIKTDKGQTQFLIHRLVCEAFIDNPHNLTHIDHMDRDRTNNDVNNLRWCSHSDNCKNRKCTVDGKKNGVIFEKAKERWTARGHKDGKNIWLGSFETYNEAKEAREKWENNDPFYKSTEDLKDYSKIKGKELTKRKSGTGSIYKRSDCSGDKWRVKFDKTFDTEDEATLFMECLNETYSNYLQNKLS
jgi:hypothetical protein